MPDPNYLSEIEREDGTVLTIRDAEAHAEIAAQLKQIETNKTNIGKVQSQANWNTNNGVKNLLPINNATDTTLIKIPIVLSSGTFTLSIDNLTSEAIGEGSRCCFMNGENVVSNIEYLQHTSNISAIYTITATSDSLWIYSAGAWNSSIGKSLSITNAMLAPKSLYDADSTYEPHALPNATLTQQTAVLEELNGAKNTIFEQLYTVHTHDNLTYIVNIYDSEATLIADGSATAGHGINTFYYRGVGDMVFIVIPPTGVTGYDIRAYDALDAPANELARVDNITPIAEFNFTGVGVISFVTNANISWSNAKFKIMMLPKSVYDAGFTDYKSYSLPNTKITPALIECVDSGKKNLLPVSAGGGTRWVDIACNIPAGDYVLSFGSLITTWESTTGFIQFSMFDENYTMVTSNYTYISLTTKSAQVSTIGTTKILRVYASPTAITDKAVTFANAMVCEKSLWDVSQKFVPYRPSYDETVEQVAENKNNISTKIGASDYASQNTGGTVRVWTTTDGSDTILHISNEAPTP